MAKKKSRKGDPFNILIVAQGGRLEYEAVLFACSMAESNPAFPGRLIIAEPQPGSMWNFDPRIKNPETRDLLQDLGAEIVPFESVHFGQSYPYGNKIEALTALPEAEPFVFFDTDTLILDNLMDVPLDFDRPSASLKREGTWPKIELYGPDYSEIWKSLYDKFGLDFDSALDLSQPDEYWKRYPYYNAGYFYGRDPKAFGARFLEYALSIRDDPPRELVCQSLDPWLDQIALPLVIHSFGGGLDALEPGWLDERTSCHYRMFPLLYAREPDATVEFLETIASPNRVKKLLKQYEPIKRMVYQNRGQKVRDMFDRDNLPKKEGNIRNQIRKAGFWMR